MATMWKQNRSFKWNQDEKDECGDNLAFEGDNLIIQKKSGENISSCTFGKEINNKHCDVFTLDFKITNADKNWLFIGYGTAPINESMIDWNDYPANGKNSERSYCFEIRPNDILRNGSTPPIYKHKFKSNELFRLQFDFNKNKLILYHGYKKIYQESLILNTKKIRIIGTLRYPGHEIEIVDWSFD